MPVYKVSSQLENNPMMIYLIGTTVTFGILLNAFMNDHTTPKTDVLSWMVLLIGTSLWFVVLPMMISKKLTQAIHSSSPAINGSPAIANTAARLG